MSDVDRSRTATRLLSPADEDHLLAAVQEYQAAAEAGRPPPRDAFLRRYPDLADALAACLDSLAFVRAATPQLQPPRPAVPAAPLDPALQLPLGDFRIVREIGRGGMGVVYRARQVGLDRIVALKTVLAGGHAEPGEVVRNLERLR